MVHTMNQTLMNNISFAPTFLGFDLDKEHCYINCCYT